MKKTFDILVKAADGMEVYFVLIVALTGIFK
jgi:hypothetical protein